MHILTTDKSIEATVGTMMGKEMILYKSKGIFKYGLASIKNYMSLHMMPIYSSKKLHEKYSALLSKASFQKGCINFKNQDEMPLKIVQELLEETAKIDLLAIMEEYKQRKKAR